MICLIHLLVIIIIKNYYLFLDFLYLIPFQKDNYNYHIQDLLKEYL